MLGKKGHALPSHKIKGWLCCKDQYHGMHGKGLGTLFRTVWARDVGPIPGDVVVIWELRGAFPPSSRVSESTV